MCDEPFNGVYIYVCIYMRKAGSPTSDSQLLKIVFGRKLSRPASAAAGCEDAEDAAAAAAGDDDDDASWNIGEMRPRGYSAPSSKHSNRWNSGCQLRVPDAPPRPLRTSPVVHSLRKVIVWRGVPPVNSRLRQITCKGPD